MTLPVMEQTARTLVAQGFAVYRFNWAYFTAIPKGVPSDQLALELQDMQAVIKLARTSPRIDPARVAVAGKSLGSLVAWQALAVDKSGAGALLITPVCSRIPKGQTEPKAEAVENYAGFAVEARPVAFVVGNQDPLCATAILYAFVSSSKAPVRVNVVGGDHNFEVKTLVGAAAQEARERNIQAVAQFASNFLHEVV